MVHELCCIAVPPHSCSSLWCRLLRVSHSSLNIVSLTLKRVLVMRMIYILQSMVCPCMYLGDKIYSIRAIEGTLISASMWFTLYCCALHEFQLHRMGTVMLEPVVERACTLPIHYPLQTGMAFVGVAPVPEKRREQGNGR